MHALVLALALTAPIDSVTVSTIDEFGDPDGEPKFVVHFGPQRFVRPLDGRIVGTHRIGDRFVVVTRSPTVSATWTLEAFEIVRGQPMLVRRMHDVHGPIDPIVGYRRE